MHPLHINFPQHDTYLLPVLSADKRRRNKLDNSSIPIEVLSKCRSFSQDRLDDELAVLCVARKIDFRLVSILLAMKHRNPEVLLLCKEKFDTEKLFPLVKDLVCTSTACQVSYSVVQTYKAFRFVLCNGHLSKFVYRCIIRWNGYCY